MSHGRLGPPTVQVNRKEAPQNCPCPYGRGPRLTSQENQVPLECPISEVSPNSKIWSFPGEANGKEPTCQCRRHKRCGFDPWVGKIPWRRAWQPFPVFVPGESHRQRSLAGYSPWCHKESDTTEASEQSAPSLKSLPTLKLRYYSFISVRLIPCW